MTDTERFEALFRAHRPQVLAYARRRVDAATAEDVVADAFLVCWRRLDDVPPEALPWLLGVARRCLANRVRGDARRRRPGRARRGGGGAPTGGDPAEALGERERVLAAFAGLVRARSRGARARGLGRPRRRGRGDGDGLLEDRVEGPTAPRPPAARRATGHTATVLPHRPGAVMTTELERLARANPVLEAPDVDAEAQLRAIVATPREKPRRRVRRRLVPALALACALVAVAVVALSGGPAPTLVERAYAQVSAGDDVVHEVVISSWTVGGKPRGSERIETWYRPEHGPGPPEGDRRRGSGRGRRDPRRRRARRQRRHRAQDRPARPAADRRGQRVPRAQPARPRGDLPRGGRREDRHRPRTNDLRRASRPSASRSPRGLEGIDAFDWYVDPGSGRPLGAIERIGDQVRTERLERYDKLEPEGAALAALS